MSSLQILEGKKIDMEQAFREYKIKDKQSAKSKRKEENKILKARSVKKEKKLVTQEIFVKIDSKGRDGKKRETLRKKIKFVIEDKDFKDVVEREK